ncbi:MAG: hypothetical protein DRO05_02335 [Thermoproteota archaeon]|nr:MAG: hypothetical protein DRO05_02335 [Candidatus Korarchaeota archaeon]
MRSRAVALLLILSILGNAVQLYLYIDSYRTNKKLSSCISRLSEENKALSQQVVQLNNSLRMLSSQLAYYRQMVEKSTSTSYEGAGSLLGNATVSIVAVRTVGPWWNQRMEGVVMEAEVEIRPGEGGVYVKTYPYIGIDLQSSLNNAISAVESFTGKSFSGFDVLVTIRAQEEVEIVDGPSAGAPLAVAILAAFEGKSLRGDVMATGVIYPDGTIGRVGGVPEKAKAAAQMGAKIFAVPPGQSRVIVMIPITKKIAPGFYVTTYKEKVVSLEEYLRESGYDVRVVEVSTLQELVNLMISG